ncbi:MAG: hypothetical protein ACK5L5_01765 [Bacteroidales bacterium]
MTNRCKVKFDKIDLSSSISAVHIVLASEINKETWYWIIDTGASNSTVNKDYKHLFSSVEAMQEQLVTASEHIEDGNLESAVIKNISFETFVIKDLPVILVNISHVCNIFEKELDIKVCGLLGADFMLRHKIKIDFESLEMELEHDND